MSNWDERFLQLAETVSTWSKDPSTKVGAAVVRPDNTLASVGFNGFPRFCDDNEELLNNRDKKLARTIHAELNAILNSKENLEGCSIYVTHPPCSQCAGAIIQSGISEVVFRKPSEELMKRWGDSIDEAIHLLVEGGVFYVQR